MENRINRDEGMKLLIQKCREKFRRTENLDFYADENYKAAERKFVKLCLMNRIPNLAMMRINRKMAEKGQEENSRKGS